MTGLDLVPRGLSPPLSVLDNYIFPAVRLTSFIDSKADKAGSQKSSSRISFQLAFSSYEDGLDLGEKVLNGKC